jgi:signal peptidase I
MTVAVRLARVALDLALVAAMVVALLTAAITVLAPVAGGRAFVIGSGSMAPAIPQGSLVLALPAGSGGYRVDDVVTVQQGRSRPYTHRVVRLAQLHGVPYVETKGDANAQPDAATIPESAIVGRVALALPLLGYLSALLGTIPGFVGFLALVATGILFAYLLDELERAVASPRPRRAGDAEGGPAIEREAEPGAALVVPAAEAYLPAAAAVFEPAASPDRMRIRETGRARDPRMPVRLERDRRNPRRHRAVTMPTLAAAPEDAPEALPEAVAA